MKKKISKNSSKQSVTKQQVRSMIKGSKVNLIKYTDTVLTLNSVASGAPFNTINMPSVGTGVNDCAGNAICIDHFEVHESDYFLDSVTTSGQAIFDRFILFQSLGETVVSASTQIFDQTADTIHMYNSPLSYDNKGKLFKPILDHKIHMDTFNATSSQTWLKLKPAVRELRFDSGTGLWSTGQPSVVITRWPAGVSGGSGCIMQLIIRMWFYDV